MAGAPLTWTAPLGNDFIRDVLVYFIKESKEFSATEVCANRCDPGGFSRWLNKKRDSSPASLLAAKRFLEMRYESMRAFPRRFQNLQHPNINDSSSSSSSSSDSSSSTESSSSSSETAQANGNLSSSSSSSHRSSTNYAGAEKSNPYLSTTSTETSSSSDTTTVADDDDSNSSSSSFNTPRSRSTSNEHRSARTPPLNMSADQLKRMRTLRRESTGNTTNEYELGSFGSFGSNETTDSETKKNTVQRTVSNGNVESKTKLKSTTADSLKHSSSDDEDEEDDFGRMFDMDVGVKLTVCTWNLKNLGAQTPNDRKRRIATLIAHHHVVAVQEVRCDELMAQLHAAGAEPILEHMSFVQDSKLSGRASRRESTGFFYNRRLLEVLHVRTFHGERGKGIRYRPMAVTFALRDSDRVPRKFTVLNTHIRCTADRETAVAEENQKKTGKRIEEEQRGKEILQVLNLYRWMKFHHSSFGVDVFVCGDFNLEPSHAVFTRYRKAQLRECLPANQKTNVADVRKSYDNIWVPANSQVVQFHTARPARLDDLLSMDDKHSRSQFKRDVSDHLPVIVEVQLPVVVMNS